MGSMESAGWMRTGRYPDLETWADRDDPDREVSFVRVGGEWVATVRDIGYDPDDGYLDARDARAVADRLDELEEDL